MRRLLKFIWVLEFNVQVIGLNLNFIYPFKIYMYLLILCRFHTLYFYYVPHKSTPIHAHPMTLWPYFIKPPSLISSTYLLLSCDNSLEHIKPSICHSPKENKLLISRKLWITKSYYQELFSWGLYFVAT